MRWRSTGRGIFGGAQGPVEGAATVDVKNQPSQFLSPPLFLPSQGAMAVLGRPELFINGRFVRPVKGGTLPVRAGQDWRRRPCR